MLQHWSDEDREILRRVYPASDKKEILNALNDQYRKKTWPAIQKEASRQGIKREKFVTGRRPKSKKPKNFLGKKQLEQYLEYTDLTIYEIAKKLKTEPDIVRRYIEKYNL